MYTGRGIFFSNLGNQEKFCLLRELAIKMSRLLLRHAWHTREGNLQGKIPSIRRFDQYKDNSICTKSTIQNVLISHAF